MYAFGLQWVPQDGVSGSLSSAAYSCNSKLIYAAFTDGNIGVFDADNLRLRCRIASSAYLNQTSSNRYLNSSFICVSTYLVSIIEIPVKDD